MDSASSSHPAVQAQLDRLAALGPGADVLGLSRITALLARLGDPHLSLPPVFHVAGTNGKGSTCAFLRAAIEADGKTAHVFTSPHLVRYNERIRVAGSLVSDDTLAMLLERTLDAGGDIGASFFEVTAAAALLAFAETSADAVVLEVGLGGRLDATNVVDDPAATGIAALGLDHQAFLGDTLPQIAMEKAGIAKTGRPLVTMRYAEPIAKLISDHAAAIGAPLSVQGTDWNAADYQGRFHYRDDKGAIEAPLPVLPGAHQIANAGLAFAMLRHQNRLPISDAALKAATGWASWPARLQRLPIGSLTAQLGAREVWLDGGHNPNAADVVAAHLRVRFAEQPVTMILGMLSNKDLAGFLVPFAGLNLTIIGVPVPEHEHHRPQDIAKAAQASGHQGFAAPDLRSAIMIAEKNNAPLIIGGSLYLAGEVLRLNGCIPA